MLESEMCLKLNSTLKQGYPSGYLDLAQAYSMIHSRLQPPDTEQSKAIFIVSNLYIVNFNVHIYIT